MGVFRETRFEMKYASGAFIIEFIFYYYYNMLPGAFLTLDNKDFRIEELIDMALSIVLNVLHYIFSSFFFWYYS